MLPAVFFHGCPSATAHRRAGGKGNNGDSSMMQRFQRRKVEYNRTYVTAEEERRRWFRVYARNVRYIDATNGEAEATGLTYELGETAYTDLTNQEFMAMYTAAPVPLLALSDDDDRDEDVVMITKRAGPVDATEGVPASVDCGPEAP
ncbi:fruit bromelain-like [Phragmites australis]|uniref:fruit bromelain-like n=1 Tax=Phragmites australis TaxID=29695 RepID=UPI002D764F72|nr:fruit bromelain-like [Phragmites australis]